MSEECLPVNLPSRATTPRHVTFYFDFLDPYAYLASNVIPEVCKQVQAALTLEAVDSRRLPRETALVRDATSPAVRAYLLEDVRQAAGRLGVEFRQPAKYPFDASMLLETCLFIKDRSGQDAMAAVTESIWEAVWKHGSDPESRETAIRAGGEVAVPEKALLAALEDPRLPGMLERATERAAGRGVVNVPAVSLGDRLFIGLNEVLTSESLVRGKAEPAPGASTRVSGKENRSEDDDDDEKGPSIPDWTFSG